MTENELKKNLHSVSLDVLEKLNGTSLSEIASIMGYVMACSIMTVCKQSNLPEGCFKEIRDKFLTEMIVVTNDYANDGTIFAGNLDEAREVIKNTYL